MSNKCALCGKSVYFNEQIKCLNKVWHEECFKCTQCKSRLTLGKQRERDNWPYCDPCYKSLFAPKGYGIGGGNVILGVTHSVLKGNELKNKPQQQSSNSSKSNLGLDDLEKLAALRDKGILTPEEFEQKKKQILGL